MEPPGMVDNRTVDQASRHATPSIPKALKLDDTEIIDEAVRSVHETGSARRFLLKIKETAKELTEVSTTIGTWPEPPLLYVGLTDRASVAYWEAPPAELGFYDDGVLLAGKVKILRRGVELESRTSVPACMIADQHGGASLGTSRISWKPNARSPQPSSSSGDGHRDQHERD